MTELDLSFTALKIGLRDVLACLTPPPPLDCSLYRLLGWRETFAADCCKHLVVTYVAKHGSILICEWLLAYFHGCPWFQGMTVEARGLLMQQDLYVLSRNIVNGFLTKQDRQQARHELHTLPVAAHNTHPSDLCRVVYTARKMLFRASLIAPLEPVSVEAICDAVSLVVANQGSVADAWLRLRTLDCPVQEGEGPAPYLRRCAVMLAALQNANVLQLEIEFLHLDNLADPGLFPVNNPVLPPMPGLPDPFATSPAPAVRFATPTPARDEPMDIDALMAPYMARVDVLMARMESRDSDRGGRRDRDDRHPRHQSRSSSQSRDRNRSRSPNPNHRGSADSEPRCYNCGKRGHMARECNSRDSGPKCYNCGRHGHIARECNSSGSGSAGGRGGGGYNYSSN